MSADESTRTGGRSVRRPLQQPQNPRKNKGECSHHEKADTEADCEVYDLTSLDAWDFTHLSEASLRALKRLRFHTPTNIQRQAIPLIEAGFNVIGQANTGSGKTLAYCLPIIEALSRLPSPNGSPRSLIIAPTRELAQQIRKHLCELSEDWTLRSILLVGGLASEKQQRLLSKGAAIIVGTPGRIQEMITNGSLDLLELRYLILDEADRLLQHGCYAELQQLLKIIPRTTSRQTLIFSATFGRDWDDFLSTLHQQVVPLAKGPSPGHSSNPLASLLAELDMTSQPRFVNASAQSSSLSMITHTVLHCPAVQKDLHLLHALFQLKAKSLVFSNSVKDVVRIGRLLIAAGFQTLVLHSGKQQKARLKSLERFKSNPHAVLVATDVAARGLDIRGIGLVVHYHLPRNSDTYIHRAGRTGRHNQHGQSLIIASPAENTLLSHLAHTLSSTKFQRWTASEDQLRMLRPQVALTRRLIELEERLRNSNTPHRTFLDQAMDDLGIQKAQPSEDSSLTHTRGEIKRLARAIKLYQSH